MNMRALILTGPEAAKAGGVDIKKLASPVRPSKPIVYTNINPNSFADVFKLYHYVVYPHYLSDVPAIFAVSSLEGLYKKLQEIPDPPPVSCPLTGEKIIRHLSRCRQVNKMPGRLSYTERPEPEVQTPLDPDQTAAAAHFLGPALVIAPAGSGKTMTVVARVVLLVQRGIDPARILCITFTRKAAQEMRDRLVRALGKKDGSKVTIKTYHALAYMLIGELTGKKPDVISDRQQILKELAEQEEAWESCSIEETDDFISFCINSLKEPGDVEPKNEKEKHMAAVYARYIERIERDGVTDQDNMLFQLYRMLRDEKGKREYLMDFAPRGAGSRQPAGRWHFVLVDEAQDNNLAQDVLTRFIAAPWDNIYWVGDEDQLLYSFRGSKLERILNIKSTYPNLVEKYLKTNYRSHPEIVEAAGRLIRCNVKRRRKTINPHRTDNTRAITFKSFGSMMDENEWVAGKIKELIENGADPEDIAVLYRTNSQADVLAPQLNEAGVPYYVYRTGKSLFATAEAEAVLNYLSMLSNPSDPEAIFACLRVPPRTDRLDQLAKRIEGAAYPLDTLRTAASAMRQWQVVSFCDDVRTATYIMQKLSNAGQAIGYIRQKFGLDRCFGDRDTSDRLNIIESIAVKFNDAGEFVNWVKRVKVSSTVDTRVNGKVRLMTVHTSKGMEFGTVFLVNCTEKHFPHLKAVTKDDIEEERRVFYVGMTRAVDRLYVTGYETEDRRLSRFIGEAGVGETNKPAL